MALENNDTFLLDYVPVRVGRMALTFGNRAENHKGMEIIGNDMDEGLTYEELLEAKARLESISDLFECQIIALHDYLPVEIDREKREQNEAYLLIVRNGVRAMVDPCNLWDEHINLNMDKKAKMYGRVVNKNARHNLCYAEFAQEPNYEEGKGRIIPFSQVPLLATIRAQLPMFFGSKSDNLLTELNYYYDINDCGIGYHGDTERKIVICCSLGQESSLCYRWYHRHEQISPNITLTLGHGDLYAMSDKAVGYDWRKSSRYTLRHAAGGNKYVNPKKKKKK